MQSIVISISDFRFFWVTYFHTMRNQLGLSTTLCFEEIRQMAVYKLDDTHLPASRGCKLL